MGILTMYCLARYYVSLLAPCHLRSALGGDGGEGVCEGFGGGDCFDTGGGLRKSSLSSIKLRNS